VKLDCFIWCKKNVKNYLLIFCIEKKVITLGDIHFVNDEKEVLIIERKSLSDLIASIKDGRYEEQSYRLINSSGMYRQSYCVYY
jgi:ERCC4-type nuclease